MTSEIKTIHFIGICGSAMASCAVALKEQGVGITGSDENIYPPMSTFLEQAGIEICAGYSESNLADQPDLVVIGNAISRGNPEVEFVFDRKWRYTSLPELLKEFFVRGKRSIVVAGTHGKTTTTTLIAWLFESAGLNPSFLIGGIPFNFHQGARFTDGEWIVIEGDEYDTAFFDKRSKFVHYLPEIGIINNLEFDHADIFENLKAIQTSFSRFINLIPRNGLLLANGDEHSLRSLLDVKHCPILRFGFGKGNDRRAVEIELESDSSRFRLGASEFRVPMVGNLNVRNALAAAACGRHCGLSDRQIQSAFESFQGIKRRMEVRGVRQGVTVIDDFGHHPTAIRETLEAMRIKYPGQKIWAAFEPRSNTTRRNIFQSELAEALSRADSVVIGPVARLDKLAKEDALDPARLAGDIQKLGRAAGHFHSVDDLYACLAREVGSGQVVCILSNGGFGGLHEKLLNA